MVEAWGIEGEEVEPDQAESAPIVDVEIERPKTDTQPNPATTGSSDDSLTLSAIESAIVRATLEGRGALAETLADMLRRHMGNQPSNVVPIRRK